MKLLLAYLSISIALNIGLTSLIIGRLYIQRRRMVNALGSEHGHTYGSIIGMIVESALPFTIMSVLYLISLASTNFTEQNVLFVSIVQLVVGLTTSN
jgi:hypothetical protein